MKKLIIILALMATAMCASAQIDTLDLGDHEPTYYYGHNHWWDYYALYDNVGRSIDWVDNGVPFDEECKPEFARYCFIDSSLRVIGVAAALETVLFKANQDGPADSILIKQMLPEQFCLYEVDSTDNSMHLLAKGEWNSGMAPRYRIVTRVMQHPMGVYHRFTPLYEVFFDSAITVSDSFYVSVTCNNAYRHPGTLNYFAYCVPEAVSCENYDSGGNVYDVSKFDPNPNHFRRKLHLLNPINTDGRFQVTDTNWHYFKDWWYNPADTSTPARFRGHINIFPIIDTSRELVCQQSRNLSLAFTAGGVATLAWEGGYNAHQWELSVCNDGCAPDDGTITQWGTRIATVLGLDRGTWYTAWVRSVCDSVHISDWCDSIRFFVPDDGDPEDPEGIETTADRYSYLMPNPASGSVTVASSFRIAEVELFSLDGRSLLRSKVDAMSTALNLDGLAAGTYIVRIATTAGTAYKKLVVK